MAIEKTYSMIKPDGVRNGHIGEIVNRFERAGLTIERMEMGMVTAEQAAANYAEHEGKPFYDGLIAYITSGLLLRWLSLVRVLLQNAVHLWVQPIQLRLLQALFVVTLVLSWMKMSFMAVILLLLQSARLASSLAKL